ncbi:MAG TPA: LysR family transcriptional regulator, partial [Burkholderiaceae bacterium]
MNTHAAGRPDPGIELRSWRQFLVLAQTLHFGRAAQQLHITQPPLSLAIQQLERPRARPGCTSCPRCPSPSR